ncbi:hypothetical protein D3C72_2420220 [compost metagenome]
MLQCGSIDQEESLNRLQTAFFGLLDHMALGGNDTGRVHFARDIFHSDCIVAEPGNEVDMQEHLFAAP